MRSFSTPYCSDEIAEIWKAIDLINSKIHQDEFINAKLESPATIELIECADNEAISRENLENDSFKQQLYEAELEIKRLKENNAALIAALNLTRTNSQNVSTQTEICKDDVSCQSVTTTLK